MITGTSRFDEETLLSSISEAEEDPVARLHKLFVESREGIEEWVASPAELTHEFIMRMLRQISHESIRARKAAIAELKTHYWPIRVLLSFRGCYVPEVCDLPSLVSLVYEECEHHLNWAVQIRRMKLYPDLDLDLFVFNVNEVRQLLDPLRFAH